MFINFEKFSEMFWPLIKKNSVIKNINAIMV